MYCFCLDIFQIWSCFKDSHVQQEWYVVLHTVSLVHTHIHIHARTSMHTYRHTNVTLNVHPLYTGQFHALIQFSTVDYAATAKMVIQSMSLLFCVCAYTYNQPHATTKIIHKDWTTDTPCMVFKNSLFSVCIDFMVLYKELSKSKGQDELLVILSDTLLYMYCCYSIWMDRTSTLVAVHCVLTTPLWLTSPYAIMMRKWGWYFSIV